MTMASRLLRTPHTTTTRALFRNFHNSERTKISVEKIRASQRPPRRNLSTKENPKETKQAEKDVHGNESSVVLTPGEKVAAGSRLALWGGVAAFASVCAYFIVKELNPFGMGPSKLFNTSFDRIKEDPDLGRRFGTPMKAYGRDGNRRSEGRRNFIEHTNYVSKDDKSNRIRIRYNLEGPYGDAFVFAEHSDKSGLVYILVQDKRGGQIIPIVDNRSMLMSQSLSGENQGMMDAMSKLLGGGGSDSK